MNQVEDLHQFRRQPLQEFESSPDAFGTFAVAFSLMQIRERAPTGDKRRIPFHRADVCRTRLFDPTLGQADVSALLPCAGMPVVLVVQGLQCR